MDKLIIKRSERYNEYIFVMEGYLPRKLREDLEQMIENFRLEDGDDKICQKLKALVEHYKKRNGIIIKPKRELNFGTDELESLRSVKITLKARRTLKQCFVENLLS